MVCVRKLREVCVWRAYARTPRAAAALQSSASKLQNTTICLDVGCWMLDVVAPSHIRSLQTRESLPLKIYDFIMLFVSPECCRCCCLDVRAEFSLESEKLPPQRNGNGNGNVTSRQRRRRRHCNGRHTNTKLCKAPSRPRTGGGALNLSLLAHRRR